uniref:Uncharacterized protein n=1 Tax=Acrobeloides nanus TaxID=290746 RepID=A0A914DHL9_9BILA
MVLYVATFLIFLMVYLQHCTRFLEKRKRVQQLMFAGASALCVTYYTIMNLLTWFSYFRARTLLIGTGDCVYLVCCSFSLFLYSSTCGDFKKEFEKSVFGRFLSVYTPIDAETPKTIKEMAEGVNEQLEEEYEPDEKDVLAEIELFNVP